MQETNTYKKLKDSPRNNYPEFLVIHHSAASENQTPKSIEDYHLSLGWDGVGYHYLITKTGEVWKGRPEYQNGAHVKEQNINFKSIGICLIGDFDKNIPPQAQVDALKTLLKELQTRYSIPNEKIVPHRHFAVDVSGKPYKSCFGNLLKDDWARNLIATPITPKEILLKRLEEIIKLVQEM